MSFSASDLQMDADRALQALDYEICGDDDLGWGYRSPNDAESAATVLNCDTAAQATAEAIVASAAWRMLVPIAKPSSLGTTTSIAIPALAR